MLARQAKLLSAYGPRSLVQKYALLWRRFLVEAADAARWEMMRHNATKIIAVRIQPGYLALDPSDPGISRELAIYGTHEPVCTHLMGIFLRDVRTAVDIGSNIGYYLLWEKSLMRGESDIIAIEPAVRNLSLLRYNIHLNRLRGVTVINAAVGRTEGDGQLFKSTTSNQHSMFSTKWTQAGHEEVKVVTLDNLARRLELREIEFLRMDIEGYEVEAIYGMQEVLSKFHPRLMIELHPDVVGPNRMKQFLLSLAKMDYETKWVVDRLWDYAWVKRQPAVEHVALTDLLEDPRVALGDRPLSVFLE